jgi:hypothetical protein
MLSCGDVLPSLAAWLDGELRGEEADSVRLHLDGCAECARIQSETLTLRAAVTTAPLDETEDLWDAVSDRIAGEDQNSLLLGEIRLLHDELRSLRGEIDELRRELTKRPPIHGTRGTPLSFPDAPTQTLKQYRLV